MPTLLGGLIEEAPMPIVMSNDGRRWACSILTFQMQGLLLGLFVNDFYPTPDNRLSDFTPASFDGYSPVTFGLWGEVFLNLQGNAESDYPTLVFRVGSLGGHDTVYGYFVYDAQGFVLWSERDSRGGQAMNAPGLTYILVPRFMAGRLC